MRVLCLHGMGTNAGIFEAQTQMFREHLPKHFEYEFFDAEHEYPAAEGCGDIFPGPYFAFYPIPTTGGVEAAHQYVYDIIEEEGPFDAVMGFSQGAALAASILLRHEKEKPFEPAPFRLAVFICGSLPYWTDLSEGTDVAGLFLAPSDTGFGPPKPIAYQPQKDDGSGDAKPIVARTRRPALGRTDAEIADLEKRFNLANMDEERWKSVPVADSADDSDFDSDESPAVFSADESNSAKHNYFSSADESEDEEGFEANEKPGATRVDMSADGDYTVHRLHPSVDKLRIGIPTAHIYGSKDPYYRQSLGLAALCDPAWASTYEHPDGHIVPRDKSVNLRIAATIDRTLGLVDVFSR